MPPIFYGYGRVSTRKQYKNDQEDSIARQQEKCETEYRRLKDSGMHPTLEYGGFLGDPAQSASKKKLAQRPLGQRLMSIVKRGDIVCSAAFDRIFRSSVDALLTRETLVNKGVQLVILDFFGFNSSSSAGILVFDIYAAIKSMESREIGRRVKEASDFRRDKGLPYCSGAPLGWRTIRHWDRKSNRIKRHWVPDPKARVMYRLCYSLYARELWSANMVMQFLNHVKFPTRSGREVWPLASVCDMLLMAQEGFPRDPRDVPHIPRRHGSNNGKWFRPASHVVRRPLQPVFFDSGSDGYGRTDPQNLLYLGKKLLVSLGLYDRLREEGRFGGRPADGVPCDEPHPPFLSP